MTAAIRIEHLGKRYRIAQTPGAGYRTLRESLMDAVAAPLRRWREGRHRGRPEAFWALRDVDLEVQPGEVVGVIGRNGAGKSTLLKILSRITRPTLGRVELRGRVGSLLEVGTGFHPELTGRENIYLNGAILGMSRREIGRKFDAIAAFAEVERFLDTPVKRYSSGMYVRLAFAVAAHLEPEILIVDEVLAVGDIAFQRKCMGRMSEVGRGGSTVLFVSHNMPAVETLCTRAILLEEGRVALDGAVPELIAEYHRRVLATQGRGDYELDPRRRGVLRSAMLLDAAGEPTNFLPLGGRFTLRVGLDADEPIELPTLSVGIDDAMGQRLLTVNSPLAARALGRIAGRCAIECRIDPFPLAPGDYRLRLVLWNGMAELEEVEQALHFSVANGEMFGEGRGHVRGLCVAPASWSLRTGGVSPS